MKARLAWVLGSGALSLAQPARAQSVSDSVRVALQWRGATQTESCVRPEQVRRRVEAQLGHAVFVEDGAVSDVALKVDVSEAGSAVQVELELMRDGESLGSRALRGSSAECGKLSESLVVVIALLVDVPRPEAAAAAPPAGAALAERPAKAVGNPPSAKAPEPAPGASVPTAATHSALNVHGGFISGLLPGAPASFGLDARAWFAFAPTLGWRLGGTYLPLAHVAAPEGSVSFSAASWQLGFSPLTLRTHTPLRIVPWLLVAANALAARGQDFEANRSGFRWLATVALSASAEWPLSARFSLTTEAALGLTLGRPGFVYQDPALGPRELFRPSFLLTAANLGISWRFF